MSPIACYIFRLFIFVLPIVCWVHCSFIELLKPVLVFFSVVKANLNFSCVCISPRGAPLPLSAGRLNEKVIIAAEAAKDGQAVKSVARPRRQHRR